MILTIKLLLYLQLSAVVFSAVVNGMKVSFFGDGYITMPLQEAKSSTNIRIKFRTQQDNAFLFLAAGRSDYCLMLLENATIIFFYKIGDHIVQLRSAKQDKLNDLHWHDVAVQRHENNITLQVDGIETRKTLPTDILALNVHFGTFIGGVGDFPADYLNDVIGFRGCLSDIFYNNINIVKRAKERTGHTTSVGVSWSCSSEFDGMIEDSMSFLNNDSYALMSKESFANGETLLFEFRTIEESGILFFNGGYDFILLEIENSNLKLTFNKAGSLVQLVANHTVADAKWHRVAMHYGPFLTKLTIDETSFEGTHGVETKPTINLEKSIFFGGVQEEMRRRLFNKGLLINHSSFKGCLRDIQVNSIPLGFPQIKVSQHLGVKCSWKYNCVENNPCINSGVCKQYGVDQFICYCDQSYCIKAEYPGPFKIFTETSPLEELLYISPLQLLEGGTIFLSTNHIDFLLDKHKYPGLTDAVVNFNVVHQPRFGYLQHFSPEKKSFVQCRSFNLVELSTDKVRYVHNSMESFNDHIIIDMQIFGDFNKIPENILGKHRFLLHANVTPVNDPPQLQIPNNRILRVVEGIEKQLDVDLFHIQDADSSANDLIYTIKPTSIQPEEYGRFYVNGMPTLSFSQADVDDRKVSFLFNFTLTESINYQILLQVSDGIETSDLVTLPVSVHPLELQLVNNTGLIMIHKSSSVITSLNLSFGTNVIDENIDIRYDVVKPPQYGIIQRLRQLDSSWVNVEWFTDSQLMLGHVRYIHTSDYPWQDEFKFIGSYAFVTSQTFDFRITFTRLRINSRKSSTVHINGSREFVLTNELLMYETIPINTFSKNIIYKIMSPTKFGVIYAEGSRKYAQEMDSFTQNDIEKNRIHYKTHLKSYSGFIDCLEFIVSVAECDDVIGQLKIIYTPDSNLSSQLSLQEKYPLHVQEGERAIIKKELFEIEFNAYEDLTFTVAHAPKHGVLCHYNEEEEKIMTLHEFTLKEMFLNDVYYCHDDTESTRDSLDLLILSTPEVDFQFVTNIAIEIKLINDNAPYRTKDRIFHVVRNGIRTVNLDILEFSDSDMNTNRSDIIYTHVSCTNGFFYKSSKYIDTFTQDDIANRKITFQHSGPDIGSASFIVSDRQHEVNGFLEIHASNSFVSMVPSNATIVQEGKFIILRNKDFLVETNLDIKFDEIHYEVLKPPTYGLLMYLGRYKDSNASSVHKSNNHTSLTNFTHLDIERDRLVYWNTEIASMDKLQYRVHIKNISAEGEVVFRIYPPAYWEPLQVKSNQTLYVEESTSVLISRDILEVVHPNISPGDITFLVTSSPMHGYLEMQSMTFDDEYNCKIFDQSAINTEKVFYIQAGVNQSNDYFVFDVTNGITWLRNLILKIVIIPEKLYMHTNIISVVEGKIAQLTANDILPNANYYRGKILEYIITVPPTSGYITAAKSRVKRFTQKQLEQGTIEYVHNGNENATDVATIIASARNKESVPFIIEFSIIPVNDEQPMITTNTGLQVWNGGKYRIKNTDLMAIDYDTPAENLTFYINHVYGGYLAWYAEEELKIEEFTQKQINQAEIVFMHDMNSRRNEISFFVSDGVFNTSEQILNIAIKPLEIIMEHNEKLDIFPLTKKQILADQLKYKCSDEDREIYYNITVPPILGHIILENYETRESRDVIQFTQSDLENGYIFYEHTSVMVEFRSSDAFYFDVRVERSDRVMEQKFNIDISVSSGGLLRFLPVVKLVVDEGGSLPIRLDFTKMLEYLRNKAGINNPDVYITVPQLPRHGEIALGPHMQIQQRFHPHDFYAKKVYYMHDHSDTFEDNILMSVYLIQGNIFLCNLTIPVTINPVNDQPFKLITQMPQMSLVEGENRTITMDMLLTEDKDTPPDLLVYEVTSGPTLGSLRKLSSDGREQDLLAFSNKFTQDDINNERIIYVHFGSPKSTTFCFTVSDGKFDAIYEIFTIKISPISLLPADEQTPVYVQQGATTSVVKLEHISLKTNIQAYRLAYNITNSPLNGIIVYKHQPTLRFSYNQIRIGQIYYMQTDQNRSNDTFQVTAYIPGTHYSTYVDVSIIVEPVIKIQDLQLKDFNERIRLTASLVNNNPLSLKLNKYNPKFIITRLPATGQLRKIIRNSGMVGDHLNERATNTFSYKELRSGVVYFVSDTYMQEKKKQVLDSFDYILIIKTFQPAQSTVSIDYEVHSHNLSNIMSGENFAFLANMNISLIAITTLIILLFLIILCCKLRMCRCRCRKKKFNKEQPPPLPCPPDLTSGSPHMDQYNNYCQSELDSMPISSPSTPIPQFSHIPHYKLSPMDAYATDDLDYDIEEQMDELCDPQQLMIPHQYSPFNENDLWTSSCDIGDIANIDEICNEFASYSIVHKKSTSPLGEMGNEFAGYSTINKKSASPLSSQSNTPVSNPLLRRNNYWL